MDKLYNTIDSCSLDLIIPLITYTPYSFVLDQIVCIESGKDQKVEKRYKRCLFILSYFEHEPALILKLVEAYSNNVGKNVEVEVDTIAYLESKMESDIHLVDFDTPWTKLKGKTGIFISDGDIPKERKAIEARLTKDFNHSGSFEDKADVHYIVIKWVKILRLYLLVRNFKGAKILFKGGMSMRTLLATTYPEQSSKTFEEFSVGDTDIQIILENEDDRERLIETLFDFSLEYMDRIYEDIKSIIELNLKEYEGYPIRHFEAHMFRSKIVNGQKQIRFSESGYPIRVQCNELKFDDKHFDLFRWKVPLLINNKFFSSEILDISIGYNYEGPPEYTLFDV